MTGRGRYIAQAGTRFPIDEAKVVALRREGLTQKELAARFGWSVATIAAILKRHDLSGYQGPSYRTIRPT